MEVLYNIVQYACYDIQILMRLSVTCSFMRKLILLEPNMYKSDTLNEREIEEEKNELRQQQLQEELSKSYDKKCYEYLKKKTRLIKDGQPFLHSCFRTQMPNHYNKLITDRYGQYYGLVDYLTGDQWIQLFKEYYQLCKINETLDNPWYQMSSEEAEKLYREQGGPSLSFYAFSCRDVNSAFAFSSNVDTILDQKLCRYLAGKTFFFGVKRGVVAKATFISEGYVDGIVFFSSVAYLHQSETYVIARHITNAVRDHSNSNPNITFIRTTRDLTATVFQNIRAIRTFDEVYTNVVPIEPSPDKKRLEEERLADLMPRLAQFSAMCVHKKDCELENQKRKSQAASPPQRTSCSLL